MLSELLGEKPVGRVRMARLGQWKYVAFAQHEPVLFDLVSDPDECRNLLARGNSGAPLAELERAVCAGRDWADLGAERDTGLRRWADLPHNTSPPSAAQYQLSDGRIVPADASLYPG